MSDCIAHSAEGGCGPALYEWLYTEPEMHAPNGPLTWYPLCARCCAYWREQASRPYVVRSLGRPDGMQELQTAPPRGEDHH